MVFSHLFVVPVLRTKIENLNWSTNGAFWPYLQNSMFSHFLLLLMFDHFSGCSVNYSRYDQFWVLVFIISEVVVESSCDLRYHMMGFCPSQKRSWKLDLTIIDLFVELWYNIAALSHVNPLFSISMKKKINMGAYTLPKLNSICCSQSQSGWVIGTTHRVLGDLNIRSKHNCPMF